MDLEPVNWVSKVADWAWLLLVAIGAQMIKALRKLSTHDAQLRALEDHHVERTKKLSDIERKIDQNQHMLLGTVEKLGTELRMDNRLILSKLLDKVPPA